MSINEGVWSPGRDQLPPYLSVVVVGVTGCCIYVTAAPFGFSEETGLAVGEDKLNRGELPSGRSLDRVTGWGV